MLEAELSSSPKVGCSVKQEHERVRRASASQTTSEVVTLIEFITLGNRFHAFAVRDSDLISATGGRSERGRKTRQSSKRK